MAKSTSKYYRRARRVAYANASGRTHPGGPLPVPPLSYPTVDFAPPVSFSSPLSDLPRGSPWDARFFVPEPLGGRRVSWTYRHAPQPVSAPPRRSGRPSRVIAGGPRRGYSGAKLGKLYFSAPSGVLVCVRRKVRKEVMHARGKAGRYVRRPRRSWSSSISCRS